MTKTWLAFHGFLGQSKEWDFLRPLGQVFSPNLYHFLNDTQHNIDTSLTKKYLPLLKKQDQNYLIGYSFGGRLAMRLFTQHPHLFDRLFILAAHPGLSSQAEKGQRKIWEKKWINDLKSITTSAFLKKWNEQKIFKHDKDITQLPEGVSQKDLTTFFKQGGLSQQPDFLPELQKHKNKVVWIIGSCDDSYNKLAHRSLGDNFKVFGLKNAGHRLLQHPTKIYEILEKLI